MDQNLKARVGDYIRTPDRGVRRVARIDGDPQDGAVGYELEDGSLIGDDEISLDDVLLESEIG